MIKNSVVIVLLFTLAGCSGIGAHQFEDMGITIADENIVKDCKFLGDVTGLTSFYGLFSGPAYAVARKLAAKEATKLGASHIVFIHGNSHNAGTEVFGRAYQCDEV